MKALRERAARVLVIIAEDATSGPDNRMTAARILLEFTANDADSSSAIGFVPPIEESEEEVAPMRDQ